MATQNVEEQKGRKVRAGQGARAQKGSSHSRHDGNNDEADAGDGDGWQSITAQAPSLLRTYVLPGVVALVCGVAGAWAYWHFAGSSKSEEEKASSKNSELLKHAEAQTEMEKGRVHQAEEEWKTAMDELRQARSAAQEARRSENDTEAILDFFKKNLLSAGRSGDGSLTAAFWTENLGKDVTLRKAVDITESRVAEAFADRPAAEASVRETLGLAYLNLKDAPGAVKQYERALALREAMQGVNDPDTAACRNLLAVAYRLAGRIADAGRLFDRNDNSPTHASALAIRGAMHLAEKNAPEAELKLRASLTIRQKIRPENWTTFDTMSMLGEALAEQRKFAEAEPLLIAGYEGMKQRENSIPAHDRLRLTNAVDRLVKLYDAWDKGDKAKRWRMERETAGPRR